jgi:hypothetical protein
MRISPAILLFFLLVSISPVHAAVVEEFDADGNGLIEPGSEITALLKSTVTVPYAAIDTNRDGKVDRQESEALDRKLDEDISFRLEEYRELLGDSAGMPIADVNRFIGGLPPSPAPSPAAAGASRLLVRRDYENIGVMGQSKDPSTVKGAWAAYTKDYENRNDIWQLRGSAMYLLRSETGFAPSGDNGGVTAYSFVPGVSFDRVSNSNENYTDVNSLTFRLGSEVEYMGGGFSDAQYFRLNLAYASDFDLESGVLALEAQWEPVDTDIGMGVARSVFGGLFDLRWRPILHAEGGRVIERGDKYWLVEDESFFRAGPKLHADLWPLFLERVRIGFDWQYLHGFSGYPGHVRLFEGDISYALNEKGNYAIGLSYRKGRLPLTFEKVDDLTLGLSVKY